MHIPDGYLSPLTCISLYVASSPFWFIAMQRVKHLFNTKLVPLLSVFAAFSFVIMMFNIPLPGGTTGHAIGVGIATVVLGQWASMIAISVALLIQAIFFGDGGITAFGANCFNMAVVGSLTANLIYKLISGQSSLTSSRRVVAASIAGYTAINVAALLTAIEFGIQPIFFKDPSGIPLYAPYPLGIAIPAMMIGHITIAGFAELIVSGGVLAYIQRTDPSLLKLSNPDISDAEDSKVNEIPSTRPLWAVLAILMILTPLGLVAAGTAWGEWGVEDYNDPAVRQEIKQASNNYEPPTQAPQGMAKLAEVWTAPIPDYAPTFLKSQTFGYIMSAMFGTGLIILLFLLVSWIFSAIRNNTKQS